MDNKDTLQLLQSCKDIWKLVLERIKHAVVFIDNESSECLHWTNGIISLYGAGAADVREFSSFESCSENVKKAVFITGEPIIGQTTNIIKDIVTSSKFEYCIVVTAINHKCHLFAHGENDQEEGRRAFEDLEDKLCEWMGNMNFTAEVICFPISIAPITENFFLTPMYDFTYPIQQKDLPLQNTDSNDSLNKNMLDLNFYSMPNNYKLQIKKIVSTFYEFSCLTKQKPEVFCMGQSSRLTAVQLSNLCNQKKLTFDSKLAILFIDRSLDVAGISSHLGHSLVDKILDSLPELPGHKNNVSVNMKLLSSVVSKKDNIGLLEEHTEARQTVFPGCLIPVDNSCPTVLTRMIYSRESEALSVIKNTLHEAIEVEEIEVDKQLETETPSFNVINKLASSFAGNPGAIMYHNNLLQLSLAASQTLSSSTYEKWKILANFEKILLDSIGQDESHGILTEVLNLFQRQMDISQLYLEDLLGFIVFADALEDGLYVTSKEKAKLSEIINKLLCDKHLEDLPSFILDLLDMYDPESSDNLSESQVSQLTNSIVNAVCESNQSRENLKIFQSVKVDDGIAPPSYQPLLSQVMEAILHPSKPKLDPDIEHISTSRDFLKMGFSMFKKSSPPHPCDSKTLIVYVIGGISVEEVRTLNEIVMKYKSRKISIPKVIIGSTRIVSPEDCISNRLFSNPLLN